jgi:hypothetical protein
MAYKKQSGLFNKILGYCPENPIFVLNGGYDLKTEFDKFDGNPDVILWFANVSNDIEKDVFWTLKKSTQKLF